MFSDENKKKASNSNGKYLSNTTLIGSNSTITGHINCQGDIRIDGIVNGNIVSDGKVVIGTEAKVNGNVNSEKADIFGYVKGDINVVDKLRILDKANLIGDITTSHLCVEETAFFIGVCNMEKGSKK